MKIFAISDLHIDFSENEKWLYNLSKSDYREDILILAGDISDKILQLKKAFKFLSNIFYKVLFVPGNHDLWVQRTKVKNSFDKLKIIKHISESNGILMGPLELDELQIIPLYAWYDFSFGKPSKKLMQIWGDFSCCRWPEGYSIEKINQYFLSLNDNLQWNKKKPAITFSHFLPRIDLMPFFIPPDKRIIYPALGTNLLEKIIRKINPIIHIYGHSHVNVNTKKKGIRYINNAFGYPHEKMIASKELICIFERP